MNGTMDIDFNIIKKFLQNPSEIISIWDSEALVWIDWGECDENIIKMFQRKINEAIEIELVDNGKDYGDDIVLKKDYKVIQIPYQEIRERDITITYLNDFINPDFEIRCFMESFGDDTLGFALLTKEMWLDLEREFGGVYVCHYFEPIVLGKKMYHLETDEVLTYMDLREHNKTVSYKILLDLCRYMVAEKQLKSKRENGEMDIKTYMLEKKDKKQKIEYLVREYNITLSSEL